MKTDMKFQVHNLYTLKFNSSLSTRYIYTKFYKYNTVLGSEWWILEKSIDVQCMHLFN